MTFTTQRQAISASYERRHDTSGLCFITQKCFLKTLVECWHVQITVEYLSTLQKSSQVSHIFAIFTKLYGLSFECFCLIGET